MIILILTGKKDGKVFDRRVIKGIDENRVYEKMIKYIEEKIYNEGLKYVKCY